MQLTRIFIIILLLINNLYDNPNDNTIFISPVKIPISLSATFGELRIDHFHSGLDIRTQGVTGKEVVASASGYIYRISVSPGGFGKALYIKHPSGYSTVYGHLEKFTPEIDKYVKARQYEKKSFLITLFPAKDKFPVKQGELIAYSGNSGSSGGPHLHFEIRRSESEIPVNPLSFNIGTSDKTLPVIDKLMVYPINKYSLVNNQNKIKGINISGGNGKYSPPADTEIRISGMAGFGIKAFDLLDDSNNKCAVYSIELMIDSISVYKYVMDAFSFNESRYINSHIDYATFVKDNTYIERTFVLPNDRLSAYKNVVNRGIYNFGDNKTHQAEIIVTDINNNRSILSFKVRSVQAKSQDFSEPADKYLKMMPYNRSNKFESENIIVNIPSGALYDTINFSYKKCTGTKDMLSDLHCIHNKFTPVHKPYAISIKPNSIPEGKKSKMLIVQLGDDQKKRAMNSYWADEYLSAEVMTFGKYYVGIDSVAPDISTNGFTNGAILTGKKEIRIRITDDLSGINFYEPAIDGKWALFEYDQKNDLLIYRFDEQRITPESKHILSLKVADNKDNISILNCAFTW
jgi:hypothetical protein